MTSDIDSKSIARRQGLDARRSMGADERATASARISDRVIRSHEYASCKRLGVYLPMRDEVDTTVVIERAWRAQKSVFAPVTDTHGTMNFCEILPDTVVTRNRYGLWEPVSGTIVAARDLDIVITPVVAFDDSRRRVGMGGGYYDRCFHFLKNRRKWLKPKLIGVAFACQESRALQSDTWDVPLYSIVTEIA